MSRIAAALFPFLVLTACAEASDQRASAAGQGESAAADAGKPAPDSVQALTDSILRIADASRIMGDSAAKVWLIVISDFQCPYCRLFNDETLPAVKREYVESGRVRLAYVVLPSNSHVHARPSAEHALCAGLQGRFWDYHDALFARFDQWNTLPRGTDYFMTLAADLELNAAEMELCVSSGVLRTILANDARRSFEIGASRTPSFLIGGRLVEGAVPIEQLRTHINAALAAAGVGVED